MQHIPVRVFARSESADLLARSRWAESAWCRGSGRGARGRGSVGARGRGAWGREAELPLQDSAGWVPVGLAGRVKAAIERLSVGQDKAEITV